MRQSRVRQNGFSWVLVFAALACFAPGGALAAHSDVEFFVEDEQLQFFGGPVFESDIREFPIGLVPSDPVVSTDDPGFITPDVSELGAGQTLLDTSEVVGFNILNSLGLGALMFWDGATWGNPTPTGQERFFVNGPGPLGPINFSFGSGPTTGYGFTAADSGGDVHQHVTFTLLRDDSGVPAAGVYGLEMELTSSVHTTSDPFFILFENDPNGTVDFEAAVAAFPVPEPGTLMVLMAGMACLLTARRSGPRA